MTSLRVIPQAAFRRSRWKNGGGETTEIAAYPEGSGLDTFVWRVSMAKVAASGPFSVFPGIDRTLCVLEGKSIQLAFEGRAAVRLDCSSPPYVFAADLAVSGEVAGAGITDLNVMSRRGMARHHVSRMPVENEIDLAPLGTSLLILSPGADLVIKLGQTTLTLPAGDAALLENADGIRVGIEAERPAEIFLIDLWS